MHSALQIVEVDAKANKVSLNSEHLATISANLRESGCESVSIISIMGAYRTGKSFLLDIFLRYLTSQNIESSTWERNSKAPSSSWLTGQLSDGSDNTGGFHWRPGMEKCTEGIWMWSQPFVRNKVGILLMDTQGAWDSRMSKAQSATVFGLTTVLSSKLIYNISMQIQEDKIDNLSYFMEFAQAAVNSLKAQATGTRPDQGPPFQELQFLVRDWANFDDTWSYDRCKSQMSEHLAQHLTAPEVADKDKIKSLVEHFRQITCSLLPHPGLKIGKSNWDGTLADLSADFLGFLEKYVESVFDSVEPKQILGKSLTHSSFHPVFESFIKAFEDFAPKAMSLSEAMSSSTTLLAKDECLKQYGDSMKEVLKRNPGGLLTPKLEEKHRDSKCQALEIFDKTAVFGGKSDILSAREGILGQVDDLWSQIQAENSRLLEQALAKFAALMVVALFLLALDKLTDYTCDWWSETCVALSSMFMTSYLVIFGFVAYQIWCVYRDRGQLAAQLASFELCKEILRKASEYYEIAKEQGRTHWQNWQLPGGAEGEGAPAEQPQPETSSPKQ